MPSGNPPAPPSSSFSSPPILTPSRIDEHLVCARRRARCSASSDEYCHGLCSLDSHRLAGEMGTSQNTPQADADRGTIMIVLAEEEERKEDGNLESDLVLLVE